MLKQQNEIVAKRILKILSEGPPDFRRTWIDKRPSGIVKIGPYTDYRKQELMDFSFFGNPDIRRADVENFVQKTGVPIMAAEYPHFTRETGTPYVGLPKFANWQSGTDYYSSLFHEMTHYARNELGKLGRHYWLEEFIAELGAAFLAEKFGMNRDEQSAAYINDWSQKCPTDPAEAFIYAAHEAEACVAWLTRKAA